MKNESEPVRPVPPPFGSHPPSSHRSSGTSISPSIHPSVRPSRLRGAAQHRRFRIHTDPIRKAAMGFPRWKRFCFLLLVAFTSSLLLYRHYYATMELRNGPRVAASLLQPELLFLVRPDTSRPDNSHQQDLGGTVKSREFSQPSSEPEKPKPSGKQPTLCPRSVVAMAKADPTFKELFQFDIPVLMWDQHFNPETWDRLKARRVPYGWQGLSQAAVGSTLHLLNSSSNTQLFGRDRFPGGCVRCAVVGNGGILNGSRQGRAIDAHDLVFRLNGAIIKGFEEDVGTKVSFYGFTVNTMKNSLVAYEAYGFSQIPQGKDLKYIFIPSDARDYIMLRSAIQGSPVPEGLDKGDEPQKYFGLEASAEKFKLLHPDFLHYLTTRFLRSELLDMQYGHLYMPSTGALMLLTALHTCDQVSAYGFITANYEQFSDHYYEPEKQPLVFYANHDMLLEAELWRSLHQAGIMELYQREGSSVPLQGLSARHGSSPLS
ncbi:alpha-N-acetylgalactosaminide alpha-2,6-sialyltransferase 2 isoform X1 [Tympanuchus pallidicinctus]|uniref:alpha-N-acetylgalactosaminide alpha-2,6-sialyltransferase 2 isoform X1 n=2 Tax=Tympanuchus pallidicinctus TaxID=109042 RepID=UPI0022870860|nr:alpha-N-acetylgalactosaminide alpha-2,6-sialyltransferase 2 isoform X1 [Tympanuchus pallidicinctus]